MIWKTIVWSITVFSCFVTIGHSETDSIRAEISIDGPALFFRDDNMGTLKELWSVHCPLRLRGCVAHQPGLALSVDKQGRPWMLVALDKDARVSVQIKDAIWEANDLFFEPVSPEIQRQLDRDESFIVVEQPGVSTIRFHAQGTSTVIQYLSWLRSETAQTLGDARLWSGLAADATKAASEQVLERLDVMQRRREDARRQMVPRTKPQVEFAQRAQGGQSFFDATGRAGY